MGVSVAIGVGIGAVVGGGAAAIQSGGDFNAIWKGALVGAVGGAVGGWAAPALVGTLGTVGAGMAAGALGGVTSGVLGAAVNGGNGEDYWKGALFGGLGGAALGGVTSGLGEAFGSSAAGAQPVDASGNMVTGTPYTSDVTGATTPLSDAGASTLTQAPAASGMGGANIDASSAINASVTGGSGTTAQPSLESLSSIGQSNAQQGLQSLGLSQGGEGSSIPFPSSSAPTNTGLYNVDTATGSYGPNGETLGTWDKGLNAYADTSKAGLDTANASYGSKGELQGVWNPEQNMYSNQAGFKTGEGMMNAPEKGGFFDQLFSKQTGQNMLGKLAAGQMMGNALKGAGSIAGMNEARQNQGQLMNLYNNMQNQYNQQNAAANQYQQQLQQTYSDPNAYLNSPEAEASRSAAMQKLLAQNAMAGRRTAGLAMQNQLVQNQLQNLAAYRQGLRGAVNYASPTGLGSTLQAAQAQSPTGNLFAGLGSMFAPAATYYMMMPNG